MKSFRVATRTEGIRVSVRSLAALLNMAPPISIKTLVDGVQAGSLPEVEQTSQIENGIIFVRTDNPEVKVTIRLIDVHADWHNGPVPQELSRQGDQWQFNNADGHFFVSNGEADSTDRPSRAGSLSGKYYALPSVDGHWGGSDNPQVTLSGRGIRVAHNPVTIRLGIALPRSGSAPNSGIPFQLALDPGILLVPVEVVRFHSPERPNQVTVADQLMLWDQVPTIDPTGNLINTDGGTGEILFAARKWLAWPRLDFEGHYTHKGWISPDSIWGKAGVRFRLVNYIEIETDNDHVAPPRVPGVLNDSILRENHQKLQQHPQHIAEKRVLQVIIMHRIAPPDAPEVHRALIGLDTIGISWGAAEKDATIAHEIGHLMLSTDRHSTLPNNIMNDPGPGTDITSGQANEARSWAEGFKNFWQHS